MKFSQSKKKILSLLCATALAAAASGCAEIKELQKPQPASVYGEVKPPQTNEFRWANGELPKTFDPAFAVSPAETQAVRAAFEGLTEWDARTLRAAPAIAASWEKSEDARTWTFYLRPNAVWSNNKKIIAKDFVRSWQRLQQLGAKSTHSYLLANVVGAQTVQSPQSKVQSLVEEVQNSTDLPEILENAENQVKIETLADERFKLENQKSKIENSTWFGVEAINDSTLRVSLVEPDADFPELIAHSALRPIYADGSEFEKLEAAAKIVTSGAFRFVEHNKSGVLLERSKNYWNAAQVRLERIRFVPVKSAETALEMYRGGEVDAVSNLQFEPLALKLLQSYTDFRRATFNAVTFYEFNKTQKPFDDNRVRRALTVAIDREQLVNDELDGASVAADRFLPDSKNRALKFDADEARKLLAASGFPDGKDFPKFRLLINRNDAQKTMARGIAAQWRKNLGIDTEIVTSSLEELNDREKTKDFALVRRVVILPTSAETANLRLLFGAKKTISETNDLLAQRMGESISPASVADALAATKPPLAPESNENAAVAPTDDAGSGAAKLPDDAAQINSAVDLPIENAGFDAENQALYLTEAAALEELPAIPLYFSQSYALVKPYVAGFEVNSLDAPPLGKIEIRNDWQAE